MRRERGFTLIELLIATVVLLGLLILSSFTYAQYSEYWKRQLGQFDKAMFNGRSLLQTKAAIESAIPYVVYSGDNEQGFYFLGREQGFTLVTASPIFASLVNASAVIRFFVERDGIYYRLVYEEAPLSETLLVDADQTLDFKYRLVMLTTEEKISFSYFGFPSRQVRFQQTQSALEKRTWSGFFDGMQRDIQPDKVRITIGEHPFIFLLPEGHEKLLNFYLERR